ncbi:MAG: YkgJ family cysteine cluster protein [Casimicrobium sp.]
MSEPNCRPGCGACCIAPSISSAIPGMHDGKPAGVRCVQLDEHNRCLIFGDPRRPLVCSSLRASVEMCGVDEDVEHTRVHAMRFLSELERKTLGK